MNSRQSGDTQEVAAAKAGISARTGRRIDKGQHQERKPRDWRTRKDPIGEVWDSVLVPLLEKEPGLTGITLWEYLDDNYPGQYPEQVLRTLQRRLKQWRGVEGPAKEVIFRQSMPAGHQGLSDFTHPDSEITIAGKPFKHLLYQFRLAFSGWRDVHIIQGGESYSALADGLQNALHTLGGAPLEHRTDSLSAAYVNDAQKQSLTRNYTALCDHYGMRGTTNNTGISHENGAIEAPHGSLKRRISQQLKLRGSNDFSTLGAYRDFIDAIVARLNKRCQGRLAIEQPALRTLPPDRAIDYTRHTVRVTSSSTISIKRGLYSVPSRLVGEQLNVHLYHDRLECYFGQQRVLTLPRVYPNRADGRARRIDYRHVIHSLAAKPQAFRFSQIRDDLLPNDDYRQLWAVVEQQLPPKEACKWIVGVLRIAYDYDCEGVLGNELRDKSDRGALPSLKTLQSRYIGKVKTPDIPVRQHTVADYDALLNNAWSEREVCCG